MSKLVRFLATLAVIWVPNEAGWAQSARVPKFYEYPVAIYKGTRPPIRLDKDDLTFRTRYRTLSRLPPNFAGHYVISEVGCGTDCTFLLTIDAKNGTSAWLKVPTGEELYIRSEAHTDAKGEEVERGYYFRPDSRLMVVVGNMDGNECGARYFEERSGRMMMIRDVHLPKLR